MYRTLRLRFHRLPHPQTQHDSVHLLFSRYNHSSRKSGLRGSADSSPKTSRHTSRLPSTKLSLEHFLIRQRVISLYRTIIRALQALPRDSRQRAELTVYAKGEFERHKEVSDVGKIRYLVSTGKTEFDGMKRYLHEMGGR